MKQRLEPDNTENSRGVRQAQKLNKLLCRRDKRKNKTWLGTQGREYEKGVCNRRKQ